MTRFISLEALIGGSLATVIVLLTTFSADKANGATRTVTATVEPAPVSITAEPTAGITLSSEDIGAYCESFGLTLAECRFDAEDVQQWLATRNSE